MQDVLKTSIPALIALTGVLVGLIVAYRKWHVERRDSSSADYRRDRRSAHKDLWERVEDVHVRLRAKNLSKAEMRKLIKEFNSYLLRAGIYLEPDVREVAGEYLNAMVNLKEAVRSSGSKEAEQALDETAEIPRSVVREIRELEEVEKRLNAARSQLMARLQRELTV
jgi:hypothetical protein